MDQRDVPRPEHRESGPKPVGGGWAPEVLFTPSAAGPQGSLPPTPRGVIQHGSRSGRRISIQEEFESTDGWAANPSNILGWHATIGEGIISLHMPVRNWGWNAFQASTVYVAAEYAQPLEEYAISDLMVRTHNWWFARVVREAFPRIPLHFPTHSEVEASGEIGHAPSGKTDAFSLGSPKADDLRARIVANLRDEWGIGA